MLRHTAIVSSFIALATIGANADDTYISASGGLAMQYGSTNSGAFTSDFTTGTGTTIPLGTPLPAGSDVGWETEFNNGYSFSAAVGRRYGAFRAELEIAYQRANVDTHTGVSAAGIALAAEDAAVLISGSDALGTDVATLVADGQGAMRTWYGMVNGYYDFDLDDKFVPYIGAGVGVGFTDVDYSPSGVTIIDDNRTSFAYQLMGGLGYKVSENAEIFLGYRYRGTLAGDYDVSLFPAELEVQNNASIFETGFRFSF